MCHVLCTNQVFSQRPVERNFAILHTFWYSKNSPSTHAKIPSSFPYLSPNNIGHHPLIYIYMCMCMWAPCACGYPVHVGTLCMWVPCACGYPVHVGTLCMWVPCACGYPIHVHHKNVCNTTMCTSGPIVTVFSWTEIMSHRSKCQICMVGHDMKVIRHHKQKLYLTFSNVR